MEKTSLKMEKIILILATFFDFTSAYTQKLIKTCLFF